MLHDSKVWRSREEVGLQSSMSDVIGFDFALGDMSAELQNINSTIRSNAGHKFSDNQTIQFPTLILDENQEFQTEMRLNEIHFKCPMCAYTSNRKDNLKTHIRRHTGEKPYTCPICQKRFTCRTGLNLHVKIHADVLCCTECSFTARTVASLEAHTQSLHSLLS